MSVDAEVARLVPQAIQALDANQVTLLTTDGERNTVMASP